MTSCSQLPLTTGTQVSILAKGTQILKDEKRPKVSRLDEHENEKLTKYVDSVFLRLKKHLKLNNSRLELLVINSNVAQAFTTYDFDEIGITSGMLGFIRNEAELVAILAHEFGHQVLHKNKRTLPHSSWLIVDIIDEGNSELADFADDVSYSRFNREKEREADLFAVKLCKKLGYNPHALAHLFDRLSGHVKEKGLLNNIKQLTSTHDRFFERSNNIRAYLKVQTIEESRNNLFSDRYILALEELSKEENLIQENDKNSDKIRVLDLLSAQLKKSKSNRIETSSFISIMNSISKEVSSQKFSEFDFDASFTNQLVIFKQDLRLVLLVKVRLILEDLKRLYLIEDLRLTYPIALYELISGKSFSTGDALSIQQRSERALFLIKKKANLAKILTAAKKNGSEYEVQRAIEIAQKKLIEQS